MNLGRIRDVEPGESARRSSISQGGASGVEQFGIRSPICQLRMTLQSTLSRGEDRERVALERRPARHYQLLGAIIIRAISQPHLRQRNRPKQFTAKTPTTTQQNQTLAPESLCRNSTLQSTTCSSLEYKDPNEERNKPPIPPSHPLLPRPEPHQQRARYADPTARNSLNRRPTTRDDTHPDPPYLSPHEAPTPFHPATRPHFHHHSPSPLPTPRPVSARPRLKTTPQIQPRPSSRQPPTQPASASAFLELPTWLAVWQRAPG